MKLYCNITKLFLQVFWNSFAVWNRRIV